MVLYYDLSVNELKQTHIEYSRTGGYIFGGEYDSDFETLSDYLGRLSNESAKVELYSDGKWFCLVDKINQYMNLINTYIPGDKNLVRVYKTNGYLER